MIPELLQEERYEEQMEKIVLPYLASLKQEGEVEAWSAKGKTNGIIHADIYELEQPEGTIVISHGFTENAGKYAEMIYYFLQAGLQVVAIDHRGHGRSYAENGSITMTHVGNFEAYVQDLIRVTQVLAQPITKGQPLYLYAHSMGGGIGAAVLEREPELFDKAILTSPMIGIQAGMPLAVARAAAEVMCLVGKKNSYIFGHGPYDGSETFEQSAATSRARFEWYEGRRRETSWMQNGGGSFGWLRASLRGTAHLTEEKNCVRIKTPILLFQAGKDAFVLPQAQNAFAAAIQKTHPDRPELIQIHRFDKEKHELYRSSNAALKQYLEQVLCFFKK